MNQTIKSVSAKVGEKWRDGEGKARFRGDACYFVELGVKERVHPGADWGKSGKELCGERGKRGIFIGTPGAGRSAVERFFWGNLYTRHFF